MKIIFNKNEKKLINQGTNAENYIRFLLLKSSKPLIEGREVESSATCEHCDEIFLISNFKKRRFCGIKCAWRNHARLAREELRKDPVRYLEYLDKQRLIMRKQYKNKKRIKPKGQGK
jgi:hypothetical protein